MRTKQFQIKFTWSRVFIVSIGVVITEEQAPAIVPAAAWTVTISKWDGLFSASFL